jgi:hypothetical protein
VIVFDLRCGGGHVFEAWFGSSADYESQQARGLVICPICGAADVIKAVMAPNVPAKSNGTGYFTAPPEAVKAMLAALAAEQKKIVSVCEHVGDRFADEARAIHLGEAKTRPIYGCATRDEARDLLEEGIAVAPLPFPVVEPGGEN